MFINSENRELLEKLFEESQKKGAYLDSSWDQLLQEVSQTRLASQYSQLDALDKLQEESLINCFRRLGHLETRNNPLTSRFSKEGLEIINAALLKLECLHLDKLERFRRIYCSRVGYEYMDFTPKEVQDYIQHVIEKTADSIQITKDQKQKALSLLIKAEVLESFLHSKYVGQKRFSLEGGDTLIPMLAALIEKGSEQGMHELIIGMAHRGRLNVLCNILHKPIEGLLAEFEDYPQLHQEPGRGDVKYHKGYTALLDDFSTHPVQVSLVPNPSHLESVNCVVQGQARARQKILQDRDRKQVLPVLIHGDAALSGQGIVYETLQMSKLEGYTTGGTIHLVINNQIGFTTRPRDSRSTLYCTDIAKAFGAPVFHLNAEDPEACIWATQFAVEIRNAFHCDVFLDLLCYRKYGHNESDEPAYTQPQEYQEIRQKTSIRKLYQQALIQEGITTQEQVNAQEELFKQGLQDAHAVLKEKIQSSSLKITNETPLIAQGLIEDIKKDFIPFRSQLSEKEVQELIRTIFTEPDVFELHPRLKTIISDRRKILNTAYTEPNIDWSLAENLALASILKQNIHVRFSGQDSKRGTFSQRHATWIDQKDGREYVPLKGLCKDPDLFEIYNSPLSEFAVLGFEYGYSVVYAQSLVIWEAQFGDFVNGGQIILDQYLSTCEQKWGLSSCLCLMLPHGYEGNGPEHSSARIERFLSLCGDDNLIIASPSTPAQLFHILRRQALRKEILKPLILFTPKGLLRHSECRSSIRDLAEQCFQEILDDPLNLASAQRIVLCQGRVYYDLLDARKKVQDRETAIIRIEQLYPLHHEKLSTILSKYASAKEILWVQEEPLNMGAYTYIFPHLDSLIPKNVKFYCIGRSPSATPAVGSYRVHQQELLELMQSVFKQYQLNP